MTKKKYWQHTIEIKFINIEDKFNFKQHFSIGMINDSKDSAKERIEVKFSS